MTNGGDVDRGSRGENEKWYHPADSFTVVLMDIEYGRKGRHQSEMTPVFLT